jgi:hypothetical protein
MLKTILRRLPFIGPKIAKYDALRASLTWAPGHYYSPIPDFAEMERRKEEIWPDNPPRSIPGIDLNEVGQLETFDRLRSFYTTEPVFPEQQSPKSRYYFDNGFFRYSDALFLHFFLRDLRPKRLIEVGSGFSSCVTLETNERFLDDQIRCTFIDPETERLRGLLKPTDNFEIIPKRIQEVDRAIFQELGPKDILFIDSSHVAKMGSDVNLLFLEVLPQLRKGVYVHVHDILYPFEYSPDYMHHAWNEAYVLRAFLANNNKWEIVLFPSFLEKFHGEKLQREMPLVMVPASHSPVRGSSIWLRKLE